MNRVFDITTPNETARLDSGGKGEVAFTVTNNATRAIRGQLRVKPVGSTRTEWLSISGEPERDFSPNATQQVTVKISVPAGTQAGKYPFRLDAVSVVNPDEDYTEGPFVAFDVKTVEEKKAPFPWWIVIAAVALLVVGGVVGWVLLRPKMVIVPNVLQRSLADAESIIAERGLMPVRDDKEDRNATEATIIDQEPRDGEVKKGSEIRITVKVPVPPLKLENYFGRNIDEVRKLLEDRYRVVNIQNNQTDSEPQGKILAQQPGPGTEVKVGEAVTLTIAVPVAPFPLPPVVGKSLWAAKSELETKGLKVTFDDQINPTVPHEQVVEQTPAANTPIKSGQSVALKYAVTLVTVPQLPWPKPIPQLPGWPPWGQGQAVINGAGLELKEVRGDCTFIVEIFPRPGTLAPKGTLVTFYTPGDRNRICYQPPPKYVLVTTGVPNVMYRLSPK